jgi:hypothetical protein
MNRFLLRGAFSALFGFLLFAACETSFDDKNRDIPLAGPLSIQVMGKDRALFLQWTKVASSQAVVPYYEIYYGTGATPAQATRLPEPVYSGDMNLVTADIPGLENYRLYYVWVKAVFPDLGSSDYSPTETGTPIPPPGPPSAVQARSSEGGIELTWTAGKDAFLYEVYYAAGAGAHLLLPGPRCRALGPKRPLFRACPTGCPTPSGYGLPIRRGLPHIFR